VARTVNKRLFIGFQPVVQMKKQRESKTMSELTTRIGSAKQRVQELLVRL
jgi:hypothetical protein